MLLLLSVIGGLLSGGIRAYAGERRLTLPNLKFTWLVLVAFIPQLFTFYLPATYGIWADTWVALSFVVSLIPLLVFAGVNYKQPGFKVVILGLTLNFLAIISNGGLMPISPNMATRLYPHIEPVAWKTGQRLDNNKDIVLLAGETRLEFLSDRFFISFAPWSTYRAVFSVGDVFIAGGIFWCLWMMGKPEQAS